MLVVGCWLSAEHLGLVPDSQHCKLSGRVVPVSIASSGPDFLPLEFPALLEVLPISGNPEKTLLLLLLSNYSNRTFQAAFTVMT